MNIANISTDYVRFTQNDGSRIEITPGESANVDIDRDSMHVVAKSAARLIVVGVNERTAAKVARETVPGPAPIAVEEDSADAE